MPRFWGSRAAAARLGICGPYSNASGDAQTRPAMRSWTPGSESACCRKASTMRFGTFDTGEFRLNFAACGSVEHPLIICLHGFPGILGGMGGGDVGAAAIPITSSRPTSAASTCRQAGGRRGLSREAYGRRSRGASPTICRPAGPSCSPATTGARRSPMPTRSRIPDRLTHLVIANGVHPVLFQRAILDDPAQRRASQYINLLREPDAEARMAVGRMISPACSTCSPASRTPAG